MALKKLAIHGALWTMGGFALSQLLRFLSSLILSRFLAPEHFGLIAIVTAFLMAISMFSDIGIGPNIIQSSRSSDKNFLNTAWTVQVLRGYILWIVCIILAYPLSIFYSQPQLTLLIPISGLSAVISGYTSTGIYTTNKNLDFKKQTLMEVFAQAMALILMIGIAYEFHSVWALVAGSLFSGFIKTYLSHRLDPKIKNTLYWEAETAKSIARFGGWILASTILGFFVNSGTSLILAKFLTMSQVGLFTMGVTLAKVIEQVFSQVANKVILPVYAQIKNLSLHEIRTKIFKIKLGIFFAFLPPLWIMSIFSEQIVNGLFDPRYKQTAWIFQLFAIAYIPTIISGLDKFYMAAGDSESLLQVTFWKSVSFFSALFLGWFVYGSNGMIYGIALNSFVLYFVDARIQSRYGIWMPKLDISAFLLSYLVIATGKYLLNVNFFGSFQ